MLFSLKLNIITVVLKLVTVVLIHATVLPNHVTALPNHVTVVLKRVTVVLSIAQIYALATLSWRECRYKPNTWNQHQQALHFFHKAGMIALSHNAFAKFSKQGLDLRRPLKPSPVSCKCIKSLDYLTATSESLTCTPFRLDLFTYFKQIRSFWNLVYNISPLRRSFMADDDWNPIRAYSDIRV